MSSIVATAAAEVYRSSPRFERPDDLWASLTEAMPELLGVPPGA